MKSTLIHSNGCLHFGCLYIHISVAFTPDLLQVVDIFGLRDTSFTCSARLNFKISNSINSHSLCV